MTQISLAVFLGIVLFAALVAVIVAVNLSARFRQSALTPAECRAQDEAVRREAGIW